MKGVSPKPKQKKLTYLQTRLRNQSFNKKLRYDFQRHSNLTSRQQSLRQSLSTLDRYIHDYMDKKGIVAEARATHNKSVVSDEDFGILKEKLQQSQREAMNSVSLRDLTRYNQNRKELKSARPKSSASPLQATTLNFLLNTIQTSKHGTSAKHTTRVNPSLRQSEPDIPRSLRKQLSLLNTLLEPCSIQKKALTSRAQSGCPDPSAITSSRYGSKKPYLPRYERARYLQASRGSKALNKFNISAWDGFKNEQPSFCQ